MYGVEGDFYEWEIEVKNVLNQKEHLALLINKAQQITKSFMIATSINP